MVHDMILLCRKLGRGAPRASWPDGQAGTPVGRASADDPAQNPHV
jgi:hypothetical protein